MPARLLRRLGHPLDDGRARGAGTEDGLDAGIDQRGPLVVRNDAADEHADVVEAGYSQGGYELRDDQMVGRQRTEADHVNVFFRGELHHGLDRLPGRRIDHLHAGVAEIGCDDAAAAVMAVESDFGQEHAGRRIKARIVVHRGLLK